MPALASNINIAIEKGSGLVKKLAEVMAAVDRIPKRGHNTHFGYDFATESDITEAIRGEMATRHLMLIPSVQSISWRAVVSEKGRETPIACLLIEFTVRDGESGESFSFVGAGEGQDSGDKCIPKAITSALKYALLKLFLIPTGDDPEADGKQKAPRKSAATPDPPKTVVNTQTGEDVPATQRPEPPSGYRYIDRYDCTQAGWHTISFDGLQGDGSALKFMTKIAQIGALAASAYQDGVPIKFPPASKDNPRGTPYLSKLELWKPAPRPGTMEDAFIRDDGDLDVSF